MSQTTNTNTPEQSAIPEEFKKWVESICENIYPTAVHDTQQKYFYRNVMHFMADKTYRHLRSQPEDTAHLHELLHERTAAAIDYHDRLIECAEMLGEAQSELMALKHGQPIPSLRWAELKEKLKKRSNSAYRASKSVGGMPYWDGVAEAYDSVIKMLEEEESLLPVQPEPKKKEITAVEAIEMAIMHFQDACKEDDPRFPLTYNEIESELYDVLETIDPSAKRGQPSIEPDAPLNDQK